MVAWSDAAIRGWNSTLHTEYLWLCFASVPGHDDNSGIRVFAVSQDARLNGWYHDGGGHASGTSVPPQDTPRPIPV